MALFRERAISPQHIYILPKKNGDVLAKRSDLHPILWRSVYADSGENMVYKSLPGSLIASF